MQITFCYFSPPPLCAVMFWRGGRVGWHPPHPPSGIMGGKSSPAGNAAVKNELRSPRGPQISSSFYMFGPCGVVTAL